LDLLWFSHGIQEDPHVAHGSRVEGQVQVLRCDPSRPAHEPFQQGSRGCRPGSRPHRYRRHWVRSGYRGHCCAYCFHHARFPHCRCLHHHCLLARWLVLSAGLSRSEETGSRPAEPSLPAVQRDPFWHDYDPSLWR
ncbi:hypothetical protein BN1708_018955, partial [Verticillium longisporum]